MVKIEEKRGETRVIYDSNFGFSSIPLSKKDRIDSIEFISRIGKLQVVINFKIEGIKKDEDTFIHTYSSHFLQKHREIAWKDYTKLCEYLG